MWQYIITRVSGACECSKEKNENNFSSRIQWNTAYGEAQHNAGRISSSFFNKKTNPLRRDPMKIFKCRLLWIEKEASLKKEPIITTAEMKTTVERGSYG